jgi:hypothetical protein
VTKHARLYCCKTNDTMEEEEEGKKRSSRVEERNRAFVNESID